MQLSEVMEPSRLKVKRAKLHIDTIIQETSPLSNDLYGIVFERTKSKALLLEPDRFNLTYRPKEPIDEHFGAIIGDAVNNLREAIDYWMNNALRCFNTQKKVHFPFTAKRQDLETSKSYITIKKAFPDAAEFISKNIEPCEDTNFDLWAVTKLCNENKHNAFLPILSVTSIDDLNFIVGSHQFIDAVVVGNANGPINIMSVPINTKVSVEDNFKTTVEIKFPQGALFPDQLVVPRLVNLSQVVSQTLDDLEIFITPYCR